MEFYEIYQKVRHIVRRQQNTYGIYLWTWEDWEQEGMLCLFELIDKHQDLLDDDHRLRVYFKTKFSNYIKDKLRAQDSYKRRINKMPYEEVTEIGYLVPSHQMTPEEALIFKQSLQAFQDTLESIEELELLERIFAGEKFKGRKAFLRSMKSYFC